MGDLENPVMDGLEVESSAGQAKDLRMDDPVTDIKELDRQIVDVLKTIFDPEIPVNIYDLGLIYKVDVDTEGNVAVKMTLTAPGCPVAESLPLEVAAKIETIPGVSRARVDIVWEPAWNKDMLSEEAKLTLGFY